MSGKRKIWGAVLAVGLATSGVHAAEWEKSTPYYEDDGWLDITEWFDGNDYNPTDEAWWRVDDEYYQAAQDNSGDRDSDYTFGYTTRDDNDWYYDYYDPDPYLSYYDDKDDGLYDYTWQYHDYDKDGRYDAYTSYLDWDEDGIYEDVSYYTFNTAGNQPRQQTGQAQQASSREQRITGEVQKTKLVQVPGGQKHVVVAIRSQQQNQQQRQQQNQQQGQGQQQTMIVDLGSADQLKNVNPKLGQSITVRGPQARVGEQQVIFAKSVEMNGQTVQVNRDQRKMTGKVADTKNVKVRGQQHQLAMVEVQRQGKTHKIAVDLGPADQLKAKVNKGSQLTFTGVPVKVQDQTLFMARSIQTGDRMVQINRQGSEQARPAGGQQQGNQQQGGQGGQQQGGQKQGGQRGSQQY